MSFYIDSSLVGGNNSSFYSVGPTGPGFIHVEINDKSELVVYKTDGSSFVAGIIYNGTKNIQNIYITDGGDLVVVYTDGTFQNVGYILGPTGPCCTGPTGTSIVQAYVDDDGYLNVIYSNHTIGRAGYIFGPTGPMGFTGITGST